MLWVEIDWSICHECRKCLAKPSCPVRAIVKPDPDEAAYIDLDRCYGCGKCVHACPFSAIQLIHVNRSGKGCGAIIR